MGRGSDLAVTAGELNAGAGVGRPHFTSATLMSVEVMFCHAAEALIRCGDQVISLRSNSDLCRAQFRHLPLFPVGGCDLHSLGVAGVFC